ncbi:MAG: hypothetical protein GY814_09485, partial [Gammaproteobacteria bacterium]|nr:hypothetical protein [Gammaproteobacteria bacterium]
EDANFLPNDTLILEAVPDPQDRFVSWKFKDSDDYCDLEICEITYNFNMPTIEAVFSPKGDIWSTSKVMFEASHGGFYTIAMYQNNPILTNATSPSVYEGFYLTGETFSPEGEINHCIKHGSIVSVMFHNANPGPYGKEFLYWGVVDVWLNVALAWPGAGRNEHLLYHIMINNPDPDHCLADQDSISLINIYNEGKYIVGELDEQVKLTINNKEEAVLQVHLFPSP